MGLGFRNDDLGLMHVGVRIGGVGYRFRVNGLGLMGLGFKLDDLGLMHVGLALVV